MKVRVKRRIKKLKKIKFVKAKEYVFRKRPIVINFLPPRTPIEISQPQIKEEKRPEKETPPQLPKIKYPPPPSFFGYPPSPRYDYYARSVQKSNIPQTKYEAPVQKSNIPQTK